MAVDINKMLKQKVQPDNIQQLKRHICDQLKDSRSKMKNYYAAWDRNIKIFQGFMLPDEEDYEAAQNNEPTKQIIGMSFAQVMTFVTFAYTQLRQGPTFFQLAPRGPEDFKLWEVGDTLLERDLRKCDWPAKLLQLLLDLGRMGLCCSKVVWDEQFRSLHVPPSQFAPMEMDVGPFSLPSMFQQNMEPVFTEFLVYQGNKIDVCSPYRIIPDMRLPLTRWKEGRFFADETEFTADYLYEMEANKLIFGVDEVIKMTKRMFDDSKRPSGVYDMEEGLNGSTRDCDLYMSTEGQIRLIPSKFGLGPEEKPIDFLFNILNDDRLVRLEPANYLHGQSIYNLAQYLPDQHNEINLSLADNIDQLQATVSWLINAHLMSQRKALDMHAVVDPMRIDTTMLDGRQPFIYTKRTGIGTPVKEAIHQLDYKDATTGNMQEAADLIRIMETVSGINQNAQGQYAPGRRSATEMRAANQGAAARMLLHVSIFSESHNSDLGLKMLSNQRQSLGFETFTKVLGETSPVAGVSIEELYDAYCPEDISLLVGGEDFFIWDGTTSGEKGYLAQNLQELALAIMSNPEINAVLNYDINKIIDEIQYLRGVRAASRFKKEPTQAQMGAPGAPGIDPITGQPVGVPPLAASPAIQGTASAGA